MEQMKSIDDGTLIEQALSGETRAFDRLMLRWRQPVYELAVRYLGDADDSHDIVQSTFIRAYQNLHLLRDRGHFRSWLLKIAVNACHEFSRKSKPTPFSRLWKKEENDPYPEPTLLIAEKDETPDYNGDLRQLIHLALRKLPEAQRSVIILKEYHGLTFREISAILDENENTIKTRLYKGLERLNRQFKQWKLTREELYESL
jgi:RNA polymerase sigma-70 factor, ECF subfamily